MDSKTITGLAAAGIAPKVIKKVGLRWLLFGVAAYYGVKLLHKKGLLPKQADSALGLIDQGVDFAKGKISEQFGFESESTGTKAQKVLSSASAVH